VRRKEEGGRRKGGKKGRSNSELVAGSRREREGGPLRRTAE
jgi:hypothetical protein